MTRKEESEKALEARLVSEVKKRNGICLKLTSQFHRGMPDRLILLPYHTITFVELKSSGKKPTALQVLAQELLRRMKFSAQVIDSTESLNTLLANLDTRLALQKESAEEYKRARQEFGKIRHRTASSVEARMLKDMTE